MQPDEITISVDEANDAGGNVDHVMTRFEEHLNRSIYIETDHSPAARNTMGFYRTNPKVNGNFRGVQKTSCKFTRDITVDGVDGSDLIAPIILEVNFSFPVGTLAADFVLARQTALALLDMDTVMDNLNLVLMI